MRSLETRDESPLFRVESLEQRYEDKQLIGRPMNKAASEKWAWLS